MPHEEGGLLGVRVHPNETATVDCLTYKPRFCEVHATSMLAPRRSFRVPYLQPNL